MSGPWKRIWKESPYWFWFRSLCLLSLVPHVCSHSAPTSKLTSIRTIHVAKPIRPRHNIQTTSSILVRIAVCLVIIGWTAAKAESGGWRLHPKAKVESIQVCVANGVEWNETYCSIKLAPYPPNVHWAPLGKRTSNWPPSSWLAKGKKAVFRQPVTC